MSFEFLPERARARSHMGGTGADLCEDAEFEGLWGRVEILIIVCLANIGAASTQTYVHLRAQL